MSNIAIFAAAVQEGRCPADAARLVHFSNDPRVIRVAAALSEYGHEQWALDRARHVAQVAMCHEEDGEQLDTTEVYEMLVRVNGGDPAARYVIPPQAAFEVVEAWRG